MRLKLILASFLSFALFSCEDYLDKTDPTATSFDEFFNDEEDLRRVVYSSYNDVFTNAGNRRTVFYMAEGRSDNAFQRIESDHHQQIGNGRINSNTNAFAYYYELHMKHLGRLNTFIASVDIPYVENESIRTKYRNILEALRVWHYFELTQNWGDVPFLLEPADIAKATQPATPKQEILDQLFPMAVEIANNLEEDEYTSDKFMFNQYSFKALIMRFALYEERYELAQSLALEIINSGKYSLHPTYGDLFQYESSNNNDEFIMWMDDASHSSGTYSFRDLGPHFRTGPGQSYLVPLKSLVDSYWTLQGRPIDQDPNYSKQDYELNPGLNRDPRYSASIMGHGDLFYGDTIDIYNPNNPMFHELTRASSSGYWFKKYVDEADAFRGANQGNMHFGLLRYAEVLLTYAEAKIMRNQIDDDVKNVINMIRERAGLDMNYADVTLPHYSTYTQEQWIELLQNERRIELAGEGLRYRDIIRWDIAQEVLNQPALGDTREVDGEIETLFIEQRVFAPHMHLWPFHESTLKVEPGLTQNPGY